MMQSTFVYLVVFAGSYLLGSIPFGFIVARMAGIRNIMEHGSGNIGATNVLRVLGPAHGVVVLLLDSLKGAIPAYVGLRVLGIGSLGGFLAGLFAIIGHNWSVFLRFRGGKGVATSAGVLLVCMPVPLGVAACVFLLVVALTRFVSLGSILSAWTAFAYVFFFGQELWQKAAILLLCLFVTYKHRANINRLILGQESRLGEKVKKAGR